MGNFVLIIHIVLAFLIIGLVLIQHGKGAEVGASFGSGASNTIFGSQGSGSFLSKLTVILALLFAISSIGLTKLSGGSTVDDIVDVKSMEMAKENDSKESNILNKDNNLKGEDILKKSSPDNLKSKKINEVQKNTDNDSKEEQLKNNNLLKSETLDVPE